MSKINFLGENQKFFKNNIFCIPTDTAPFDTIHAASVQWLLDKHVEAMMISFDFFTCLPELSQKV